MIKLLTLCVLIFNVIQAKDIKPIATLQASALVSDFVEGDEVLYVGTDAAVVDIIDLTSRKIIN